MDLPTGWHEESGRLRATYRTGSFLRGVELVRQVAEAAEEMNHHPDVELTYPSVSFRLVSHDVGSVTDRDGELARRISGVAEHLGIPAQEQ